MSKKVEIAVGGKKLAVSNLGKVLYPKVGFTKGEVIDYYIRISPVLLPHLKNRPITLKRYPDGVKGFFFYEKQCPSHRPAWVKTTEVPSRREAGKIDYCMMNDLPALVWAANLADLELHTFLHRAPAIERPTALAFDLDPGAPLTSFSAAALVFGCKQLLRGLACNPLLRHPVQKVLQLFVPLNTATTYEKTKAFNRLSFDSNTVLKRVERQGDLFAPVLALKQRLPDLNRLTSFQ